MDEPDESQTDRIIRVARELINQTGDFELKMSELAARAHVSLRCPYKLFGSKNAIISEILHRDQLQYGFQLTPASDEDLEEVLFREMIGGLRFIGERQAFYRALFRATQAYSAGGETETAREMQVQLADWCRRASAAGLLQPSVVPELVSEILTNIFAAEVRYWANSGFDIDLASLRIIFGLATVLAGCGAEAFAAGMRAKANEFQTAILEYEDPSGLEAVRTHNR